MKLPFVIVVGVLIVESLLASSTRVASGAPAALSHASAELSKLAEEFRQFRSPVFGQRTWRPGPSVEQFHDTVLASGQIPLALVRWEMTGHDDQIRKLWDVPPLSSTSN